MKNCFIFLVAVGIATSCQTKSDEENSSSIPMNESSQNKRLIESYFELFNAHKWKEMAELYSDSAAMKDPSIGKELVFLTPKDIEKKYSELNQFIPNVKDSIVSIIAVDDKVVVEFISKGKTLEGETFELPICTLFQIQNSKITQDFTYYDNF